MKLEDIEAFVHAEGGVVYKRDLWKRFHHGLGDMETLDVLIQQSKVLAVTHVSRCSTPGPRPEIVLFREDVLPLLLNTQNEFGTTTIEFGTTTEPSERGTEAEPLDQNPQNDLTPARERAKVRWRI
jgi:hypothetical protein